ncbi:hypothetical protein XELAEV_18012637mg [Xenopus laevis]|uniref:Uncharacterized protein n=1 Tax=Xenopus laevis TaxID=8355 RepID=A0A974HYK0_XENLA|nr:hypothetical protein XELAEV_18012637mg [Xenopus laevis]
MRRYARDTTHHTRLDNEGSRRGLTEGALCTYLFYSLSLCHKQVFFFHKTLTAHFIFFTVYNFADITEAKMRPLVFIQILTPEARFSGCLIIEAPLLPFTLCSNLKFTQKDAHFLAFDPCLHQHAYITIELPPDRTIPAAAKS